MTDYLIRQWEQLQRNNYYKERNFFYRHLGKWLVDFKVKELTMKVKGIDETTRDQLRTVTLEGCKDG